MPAQPRLADCHAHIIDLTRYPAGPGAGYTPLPHEQGNRAQFDDVLAAHGFSHALLVQPSCYGFDNTAMLDAIDGSGGRFAGIAVVSPRMPVSEMRALRRRGIVGIRLNLGNFDPDLFSRPETGDFLKRVRDIGWFVQVYAVGRQWDEFAQRLAASGTRILIDHLGHPDVTGDLDQPGFRAVLALAREMDAVIKLSGAFRLSPQPAGFWDVDRFAQAVIARFGVDRCIWGSDWPFINIGKPVSYAEQLAVVKRWLPDEAQRAQVLVANPARLFGFPPGPGDRR